MPSLDSGWCFKKINVISLKHTASVVFVVYRKEALDTVYIFSTDTIIFFYKFEPVYSFLKLSKFQLRYSHVKYILMKRECTGSNIALLIILIDGGGH